jgi:hypothetical protein
VFTIPTGRPRIVGNLRVDKALVAQHVSKDFLESAERLAFKRQPEFQLRPVQAKPLADFGRVDAFGSGDLYAW